jgi:FkbM family methyltransferase
MTYEFQPSCQIAPEILDRIFLEAFGFKTDGQFVEVGANNGWENSNTWGLAKIGWRGLYVEPVPELFEECARTHVKHPRVEVVRAAIGATNEEKVTLGMCEFGATLCPELASETGKVEAEQMTLDELLERRHVAPGFDLLVVDVEGAEAQVLAGFDCAKWRPKLAIIERPPFRNCFRQLGYQLVYDDWINTVFKLSAISHQRSAVRAEG